MEVTVYGMFNNKFNRALILNTSKNSITRNKHFNNRVAKKKQIFIFSLTGV